MTTFTSSFITYPVNIEITPAIPPYGTASFGISSSLNIVPITLPLLDVLMTDAQALISGKIENFFDVDRELKTLLNFGSDFQWTITNWIYDPADPLSSFNSGSSILVKLYEPLPDELDEKTQLWISRELSPPVVDRLFTKFTPSPPPKIYLRPANIDIDVTGRLGITSQNVTLQGLLSTSSFNTVIPTDPVLERWYTFDFNSVQLNVDYTDFTNFIFFGGAKSRIDAFVQKLLTLENYNEILLLNSASIEISLSGSVTGSITGSLAYPALQKLGNDRIDLIRSFDPFEQFLYYTTGSSYSSSFAKQYQDELFFMNDMTYPKISGSPIPFASASDWYTNLTTIGSAYDQFNALSLVNNIPTYVQNDVNSRDYLTFLNLVGYHFDIMKSYIDQMTNIYDRNNNPNIGLSEDLLWGVAQSLGIDLPNQYAIKSLIEYTIGSQEENNPIVYRDSASETWKRFLHNHIFLMKTKGTATALRSLANTYGLLSDTLRVRESETPGSSYPTGTYEQYTEQTNVLNITSGSWIQIPWAATSSLSASSLEVRFATTVNSRTQVLLHGGNAWSMQLVPDTGTTGQIGTLGHIAITSGTTPLFTSPTFEMFTGQFISTMLRLDQVVGQISGTTGDLFADGTIFADGEFFADGITTSITGSSTVDVGAKMVLFVKQASQINDPESLTINLFAFEPGIETLPQFSGAFFDGTVLADTTARADGLYVTGFLNITSSVASVFNQPTTMYLGTSGSAFGSANEFVGQIDEFRVWGIPLSESTFHHHTLYPGLYNGNAVDDPRNFLWARLSFNKPQNLFFTSSLPNESPYINQIGANPIMDTFASIDFLNEADWPYNMDAVDRTVVRYTPNAGGNLFSTNKIKIIDSQSLDLLSGSNVPILSPIRSIVSLEDKLEQAQNTNLVGFYFSLTDAIDDSMIRVFGNINLQDLIGDPADYYNSQYILLNQLNQLYWSQYAYSYDISRFVDFVENLLNALFKQARELVPVRTKLLTGIVHEPTILERNKLAHKPLQVSAGKFTRDQTDTLNLFAEPINSTTGSTTADYLVKDALIEITESEMVLSNFENFDAIYNVTETLDIEASSEYYDETTNFIAFKNYLLHGFGATSDLQLSPAQLAEYLSLLTTFQSPNTINVPDLMAASTALLSGTDDFVMTTINPLTDFTRPESYTYFNNIFGFVTTTTTELEIVNQSLLRNRGNWMAGTVYTRNDLVYQVGISGSLIAGDNYEYVCIAPGGTVTSYIKPSLDTRNWVIAKYVPVEVNVLSQAIIVSGSVSIAPTGSGFPVPHGYWPTHYRITHNRARGILNHQYLGCLQTSGSTSDGGPPVSVYPSTDSGGRLVVLSTGAPIIPVNDNTGPILTVE